MERYWAHSGHISFVFFDLNYKKRLYDEGLDGIHPGPKSHEAFANNLYLDLKNEITKKFNRKQQRLCSLSS